MERKKAGRPPGSQNKVGKEQKEFIKALLGETQEQFRNTFIFYANGAESDPEKRRRFSDLYVELSKMVVPKPIEADLSLNKSSFDKMLEICQQWDDEDKF